jgi:hypothetical protein
MTLTLNKHSPLSWGLKPATNSCISRAAGREKDPQTKANHPSKLPKLQNMALATASIDDPETWHLFANLDNEFLKVLLSLLEAVLN